MSVSGGRTPPRCRGRVPAVLWSRNGLHGVQQHALHHGERAPHPLPEILHGAGGRVWGERVGRGASLLERRIGREASLANLWHLWQPMGGKRPVVGGKLPSDNELNVWCSAVCFCKRWLGGFECHSMAGPQNSTTGCHCYSPFKTKACLHMTIHTVHTVHIFLSYCGSISHVCSWLRTHQCHTFTPAGVREGLVFENSAPSQHIRRPSTPPGPW